MGFTPEKKAHYVEVTKKYDIRIIDDLPRDNEHQPHRDVLAAVERLKSKRYHTYVAERGSEVELNPWKLDTKRLADKLVGKASDCLEQNEATWRFACEPLVLSRLSAEIACRRCRGRLWRSEVEVTVDVDHQKLSNRQSKREVCRCDPLTRPSDVNEVVGLNKLFIDRAQAPITYPPQLAEDLQDTKNPDRICGLRCTRNFEVLLHTPLEDGTLLDDSLPEHPLSKHGKPLLFPFLVIEAKKADADDWYSICLQTAFPIYSFLHSQRSLRSSNASGTQWVSGPLVWFLANRGADWRLYIAYQQPDQPLPPPQSKVQDSTLIALLWKGNILERDDALQLLLLVDYICDWARDIYRPAILTELKTLANSDSDGFTILTDTDIFSSRYPFPKSVIDEQAEAADHDLRLDGNDTLSQFRELDSPWGAVRHISAIRTNFLCVLITADNVQTFLRSIGQRLQKQYALQVLRLLDDKVGSVRQVLSSQALTDIERIWSGFERTGIPYGTSQAKFYTTLQLTYYMTQHWEQTRDLCIAAVSEEAFATLVSVSGLKPGRGKTIARRISRINDAFVIDIIRRARASSARENLLATITRASGCIRSDVGSIPEPNDLLDLVKSHSAIWEVVNRIYKLHKPGDLEPDQPFLRISKQDEDQRLDSKDSGFLKWRHPLQTDSRTGVLITAESAGRDEGQVCLYIISAPAKVPTKTELGQIIKESFENFDVYHTMKNSGLSQRVRWQWNLSSTYGMYTPWQHSCQFTEWLKELEGAETPPPTRQGSPRGPDDTGRGMFERNYRVWQHPIRTRSSSRWEEHEATHIKGLVIEEANSWAQIAQQRKDEGTECCSMCAGPMKSKAKPIAEVPRVLEEGLLSDKYDMMIGILGRFLDEGKTPAKGLYGKYLDESGFKASDSCIQYYTSVYEELCVQCKDAIDPLQSTGYPPWFKILMLECHSDFHTSGADEDTGRRPPFRRYPTPGLQHNAIIMNEEEASSIRRISATAYKDRRPPFREYPTQGVEKRPIVIDEEEASSIGHTGAERQRHLTLERGGEHKKRKLNSDDDSAFAGPTKDNCAPQ